MISLFHSYHVDKVSENDKAAFCKISGTGILIVGAAALISGLLTVIIGEKHVFEVFAAGFVLGFGMLIYAGLRYNR